MTFCLVAMCNSAFAACVKDADSCSSATPVVSNWDKSLAFGFNLTQGNTDSMLLTILGNVAYEKDADILNFNASYGYAEDSTNSTEESEHGDTTRNDLRLAGSYKNLFSEKAYLGFGAEYRYDEIADIDYRVTLSPSVGYYLLKDADFSLNAEVGPSYIFEKVGGLEDNNLAPRVGERFSWTISCTSKIYQTAEYIYDVNDSDNYMINAEVGIEAAISSNLSLVMMVRDNFDNEPADGKERNDVAVISALKVSL